MLKELQLFLLAVLLLSCGFLYQLTLKSSCLLSCLAPNKSQQGLEALLGKGRSIVFLETSERTEPPPLVSCAVESAAKVYPEQPVMFFMKGLSHSMQMPPNSTSPAFSLLSAIDNVFLLPLNMTRLFEDTPLFSWYTQCHLCEKTFLSASYLQSHLQHRHEGMAQGEKQKQEESVEEVVRYLQARLTSTQEELTALLRKQWQLQEAKTTCPRERDTKAMFEEWKEELSEEIDEPKKVFWDELESAVLPDSPLEEVQTWRPHTLLKVTQLLRDRAVLGLESSSLNLKVPSFLLDILSTLFRNTSLKLSQDCILACNPYD